MKKITLLIIVVFVLFNLNTVLAQETKKPFFSGIKESMTEGRDMLKETFSKINRMDLEAKSAKLGIDADVMKTLNSIRPFKIHFIFG